MTWNTIRLYIILGIIGLGGLMILAGAKALELAFGQDKTLRITQDSNLIVNDIRNSEGKWYYLLEVSEPDGLESQKRNANISGERLTNLNLQSIPQMTTLIVRTNKPIGYMKGDTLKLIDRTKIE